MILTIKKKGKRNRIKYSVIGLRCDIGSPILYLLTPYHKLITLKRHELEIAELEIIHKVSPKVDTTTSSGPKLK